MITDAARNAAIAATYGMGPLAGFYGGPMAMDTGDYIGRNLRARLL